MARLRQYYPNNYGSSSSISAEFENVIRYIVAAERGNRSLGEMMGDLFDEDGNLDIDVEFDYNAEGLQMRVGENDDWVTLATPDEIRGPPGRDVGTVPLPIISGLAIYTATASQTVFNYVHAPSDLLFVVLNGLLLTPTDEYTSNATSDTVTLASGAALNDTVIIYKVRGDAGVTVNRDDTTVNTASQSVFGVTFPAGEFQCQIYLNGLLLAETLDYVLSPGTSSFTLLEAAVLNDVVSVIFISTIAGTEIPGFLVEGVYTDMTTGLIPFAKIDVPNNAIATSKVNGLVTHLTTAAKITVGSSTPVGPASGNFWLDTSLTPSDLKVYDSSAWFSVQPQSSMPTIRTTDANYAVFINSTGTGYVYQPIDFSPLILNAEKGVAGGVATLGGDGKLATSQLPTVRVNDAASFQMSGAVANATYVIRRLFRERIRITGLTVALTSGTCTIQLAVSGVAVGSTYSASSTANDQNFVSVIEVDALTLSKTLDVIVTSGSSPSTINLTVAFERLN